MTVLTVPNGLAECEAIIEQGLKSFVDVGIALMTVNEGRLYRASYPTFEAYCSHRWNLSRQRVYDLMKSSEVTRALSAIADTPKPANEGQARELHGLEPEVAAEVMTKAADSGKVTAATIKEAREKVAPVAKVTETHKTEYGVNTETGEIIAPPAAPKPLTSVDTQRRLQAVLDNDEELSLAAFAVQLHKAISAALALSRFDAERSALALDRGELDDLGAFISSINDWHDRVVKASRPRVVGVPR